VSELTTQKRKPFEQQPAFKESSEILKREKRLSRYQKKAETEDTLNKLIPDDTIPEVEGKPIKGAGKRTLVILSITIRIGASAHFFAQPI